MKYEHTGAIDVPEDINRLLETAGLRPLSDLSREKFALYLELIVRWNARMNLTGVRKAADIQTRHFVESIACAEGLPEGINSLLDYGSGAGFPGIPIAICRPELDLTLAESQAKKAAFLQEVVRTLGLRCRVHGDRAENLRSSFDCVTLRAVDHMERAVGSGSKLVCSGGWLVILTTESDLQLMKSAAKSGFEWREPVSLPGTEQRILMMGQCLD